MTKNTFEITDLYTSLGGKGGKLHCGGEKGKVEDKSGEKTPSKLNLPLNFI